VCEICRIQIQATCLNSEFTETAQTVSFLMLVSDFARNGVPKMVMHRLQII